MEIVRALDNSLLMSHNKSESMPLIALRAFAFKTSCEKLWESVGTRGVARINVLSMQAEVWAVC